LPGKGREEHQMRRTDVVVVGGGLAGSTAAAMLGRAGIDAVLIDPHEAYPDDFRCEKLDATQVAVLEKTGLADAVLAATTLDGSVWVARRGRLVEKRPSDQHGILYQTLVNTVRSAVPASVEMLRGKVTKAATTDDRQSLTLSDGQEISARLIVMASGLNLGFGHTLALTRETLSPNHSITIGFDLRPTDRPAFYFPALTYWPERPSHRMAYLTLFPTRSAMRANLMVYRDMNDPWLRRMRSTPREALAELMPRLGKLLGAYEVDGFVKIRPADLYATGGYLQPGLALVGDAFATSCPAAGTGTTKVFNDVERLCNVHIPAWLATGGMGLDKIAAFYADPAKQEVDAASIAKAYWLRSLSIDTGAAWRVRRQARYFVGLGRNALPGRRRLALASRAACTPVADGALNG
jgi:2-polyprenyl-6-methoxyphenol hydroxylase-like FAD-dependent oxidoreductase